MSEFSNIYVKRSSSPISAEILERIPFKRPRCYDGDIKSQDDDSTNSTKSRNEVLHKTVGLSDSEDTASVGQEIEMEKDPRQQELDNVPSYDDSQKTISDQEYPMTEYLVKTEIIKKEEEIPAQPVTPLLDPIVDNDFSRDNLSLSGAAGEERWRAHRMAEDYISLATELMLPDIHLRPFGYDPAQGKYPIESITAYGVLTSPLRRPSVVETWSPYEIATFEAALAILGKQFHAVQKLIRTKSTKEIVEFYYIWKKTHHYKMWKKQYIPPEMDLGESDEE